MKVREGVHLFSNGVMVVNTTPHPIRFQEQDGSLVEVAAVPAFLVNAQAVEEVVDEFLVKTTFVGCERSDQVLHALEDYYNNFCEIQFSRLIIVGSLIAAQAYPGRVFAMTPVPGFERVAPAEKRMSISKFTTY